MRFHIRRAVLALGIMLLAGPQLNCLPANEERRVGTLGGHGQLGARVLEAPDTVQAGHYFTVKVTTEGSSSCDRADGAEVSMKGAIAEIIPYDLVKTQGVCTTDLAPIPRQVLLKFDRLGVCTVRVVGRTYLYEATFIDTVVARVVVRS